jgi:NADPH:quinone reductase-like Zn-dependent oxidoreductase
MSIVYASEGFAYFDTTRSTVLVDGKGLKIKLFRFIAGGAGGVGSLAIQIAKTMLDASYVCMTASAGAGVELCFRLGAHQVMDYKSEDFCIVLEGQDFDMAFDTCNEEGSRMGDCSDREGKLFVFQDSLPLKPSQMLWDLPCKAQSWSVSGCYFQAWDMGVYLHEAQRSRLGWSISTYQNWCHTSDNQH